jgi:selenocysteine lyase/cysteine desulfurase
VAIRTERSGLPVCAPRVAAERASARDRLGLQGRRDVSLSPRATGNARSSRILTVPAAIEWQREHDWDAERERCRALAARTPDLLGLVALGTGLQMVSMRLPADAPEDLQELLYDEYRIEIPVFDSAVGRVIRASFQGYNDESDLEALATALEATRVTARSRGS